MHKYAHFRKSSRRWRPQFPFFISFFALVSEEPSPQRMCNVCTIQQHISSSETEPGLNLWPDPTRPDPDAFWPGDATQSLSARCFELRDYFHDGAWPWNPGQRSLKVIESGTIRYGIYMVSHYYPIVTLSVIYSTSKMTGPWTPY